MIYVASPYSHPSPAVRQERYEAVRAYIATRIINHLEHLYSPIVHFHPMAVAYKLPTDSKFWSALNNRMILRSDAMRVLMLPGYDQSIGVQHEVEFCALHNRPVEFIPWQ